MCATKEIKKTKKGSNVIEKFYDNYFDKILKVIET